MPPLGRPQVQCQLSEYVMSMPTDAGAPILPLAEQLASSGEVASKRTLRRRAFLRLHRCDELQSPYGALIVDLPVVDLAGTLHVNSPNTLAFFFHAARLSVRFFDFMRGLIHRHGILTIGLYTDGVVYRETKKDRTRLVLSRPSGSQFASSPLRWVPICYPTHDHMQDHKATVSKIVMAVLESMFPEGDSHSWENGVMLRNSNRTPILMRVKMGPMPQDADAFKHVFALKAVSYTHLTLPTIYSV